VSDGAKCVRRCARLPLCVRACVRERERARVRACVRVFVCVCVCVRACVRAVLPGCTLACICVRLYVYVRLSEGGSVLVFLRASLFVHSCICAFVRERMCARIHLCVSMLACMRVSVVRPVHTHASLLHGCWLGPQHALGYAKCLKLSEPHVASTEHWYSFYLQLYIKHRRLVKQNARPACTQSVVRTVILRPSKNAGPSPLHAPGCSNEVDADGNGARR